MTRGLRNKNPFNIKISASNWKGKKPQNENTDGVFEQFWDIDYGIRAGVVLLRDYIVQKIDTPRKIITRYAPGIENDLTNYLFFVSGSLDLDTPIEFGTSEFCRLCCVICDYESQVKYAEQNIQYIISLFNLNYSTYRETDKFSSRSGSQGESADNYCA